MTAIGSSSSSFAYIRALAASADGRMIAISMSSDAAPKTIPVMILERDPDSGTTSPIRFELNTGVPQRDRSVVALALSRDGRFLAAGDAAGGVRTFKVDRDTRAIVEIGSQAMYTTHRGKINELVWDEARDVCKGADKLSLVVASADRTITVWSPGQDEPCHTLEGHLGSVEDIELFPDGSRLLSAGQDGIVYLWDLTKGERIARHLTMGPLVSAAVDASGEHYAAGADSGAVFVWKVPARGVDLVKEIERLAEIAREEP